VISSDIANGGKSSKHLAYMIYRLHADSNNNNEDSDWRWYHLLTEYNKQVGICVWTVGVFVGWWL
jgi:hypothetical protein